MQRETGFAQGWGWAGIGALAALGFALALGAAGRTEFEAPGPPAVWAADRDAGMLYVLDEDLILVRRQPSGWPLDIECTPDGGAFVLRSGNAGSNFGHRLDKFDAQGMLINETYLEPCLDLDTLEGRQALLIEGPSSSNPLRRAVRLEPEGALHLLAQSAKFECIAGSRASVLIGTSDGWVERLPVEGGAAIAQAQLGGAIVDLARGPEAGSAFALDAANGGRLLYLAPDLSVRWEIALGMAARHLGVVAGEERVWLADTSAPRVRRYGPGGALELDRGGLPLSGLDRTLPWKDDGVLVVAPGAILHLDAMGVLAPGQGGFDYLTDLSR